MTQHSIESEVALEGDAQRREALRKDFEGGAAPSHEGAGGAVAGGIAGAVVGVVVGGPVGAVVGGAIGITAGAAAGALDRKAKSDEAVVTSEDPPPTSKP